MAVTLSEFIDSLMASRLMTDDQLREFRASLPNDQSVCTAKELAQALVAAGKLTAYQTTRIMEGQPIGLILGNYVILNQIGSGGMGDVYKAEHQRMRRPVVIKVLHPRNVETEIAIKRFQREVIAAARVSHPNIVTAFDASEEAGVHFLVMEYVDGQDLSSVLKHEGLLSVERSVDFILQAARGLAAAHAHGILHRDVKPSNLFLDNSGVVKVLDLGLARLDQQIDDSTAEAEREDPVTQSNQIVGTVDYMSPEQADASRETDERADIYGLGCTLYRLLVGRPPYQADSLIKKLVAHRVDPIPPLCDERRDVPPYLDGIFQKMVAKQPEDRYASMADVVADLEACQQALGSGGAATAAPPRAPLPGQPMGRVPSDRTKVLQAGEDTDESRGMSVSGHRYELAIGIDLGTTYSVVSYVDEAGRLQTLSNAEGDKTTPSVVLFDGQDVIVGKEAVKAMSTDMDYVAECAKRELGHRHFHKAFSGSEYPPEALQAWVLNKLRDDAWKSIGRFEKVVITVPAYFDEVRRKATQDAGYMAGFQVLDIINEPTAAAIAFGYQLGLFGDTAVQVPEQRVLVYDLGGGTFDVTVMELKKNRFVTLATDGDVLLGGRDWDQRLVDYVAVEAIRKTGVDPREDSNTHGRLLRNCEEAKRALSVRNKTNIVVDLDGNTLRIPVTRQEFEEMTMDLVERTSFTTRKTLRAAGLTWEDVDRVLLVGGATRIPAVVAMLEEISGKKPDRSVSPDEAVAHGAALHAAMLLEQRRGNDPSIEVRNVNSHSLGIAGVDPKTKRKQTAVVIPRNTGLPIAAKRCFSTSRDGQSSILLQIVEGESESPDDCVQIGRCSVRDLPPNLPAKTPVEVQFRYEQNGRLTVRVRVAGTKSNLKHEIRRENSLGQEQLDHWREQISGLPAPTAEAESSETTFTTTPELS